MATWAPRRSNGRAPQLAALIGGTACAVLLAIWLGQGRGGEQPIAPRTDLFDADATQSGVELLREVERLPLGESRVRVETLSGSSAAGAGGLRGRVVDPFGAPVAGARVWCVRWEASVLRRGDGVAVREAESGSDGWFDLGEPPDFACILRAEHPDWASADVGPRRFDSNASLEIALQQGWRLEGEVVDDAGAAVASASVVVSRPPPTDGPIGRWVLDAASTDEHGHFRTNAMALSPIDIAVESDHGSLLVRGLEPRAEPVRFVLEAGRIVRGIVVDSASGEPVSAARVRHEDWLVASWATDESGRFELTLPRGLSSRLSVISPAHLPALFDLGGEPWTRIELARRPRVRGHVLRSAGSPAAGAQISLRPEADSSIPDHRTVADENGAFDWLLPVAGVNVVIVAELDGLGSASELDRECAPGSTLDGIIIRIDESSGLWGWISNQRGEPISGAVVEVYDPSSPDLRTGAAVPRLAARSASDGTYRLVFESLGEWTIRARAQGYADRIDSLVLDRGNTSVRRDLVLHDGGVIEGRVVDASGRGIAAAEVGRADEIALDMTTTDGSGAFRFEGASDSMQDVVAHKKGYAPALVRHVQPSLVPLEIVLEEGAVIRGTVVAATDGEVVSEFFVMRWREDSSASSLDRAMARVPLFFSSEAGRFELVDLAAGSYTLRVDAAGFVPWEGSGVVARPAGEGRELLVEMERGATLIGWVLDPDGAPIGGATVRLQREADPLRPYEARESAQAGLAMLTLVTLTSDADGRCSYSGLRGSELSVTVEADGYAPASKRVKLSDALDHPSSIEFRLSRATTVSGRVWTQDGVPAPGATVFAHRAAADGWSFSTTQCDPDGFFLLDGIALGCEYTIVANVRLPETGQFLKVSETLRIDGPITDLILVLP